MIAGSSENCSIGESPMFRCDQYGETPKVTQIVIVLNSVVRGRSTNCCMAWKGAIPFVPATGESRRHVQTQVLVAFTGFLYDRGRSESARQATPANAKHSKSIERKAGLLMVKAALVTISQEKCTFKEVSSEMKLGVLWSCLQRSKISTDWSFGWVGSYNLEGSQETEELCVERASQEKLTTPKKSLRWRVGSWKHFVREVAKNVWKPRGQNKRLQRRDSPKVLL